MLLEFALINVHQLPENSYFQNQTKMILQKNKEVWLYIGEIMQVGFAIGSLWDPDLRSKSSMLLASTVSEMLEFYELYDPLPDRDVR